VVVVRLHRAGERRRHRLRRALHLLFAEPPLHPEPVRVPASDHHRGGERRWADRGRVLRRAAQGGPLRADPAAALAGLHRRRGPALLRAPRHRPHRHRPRRHQHPAPPPRAGRLDPDPADRQVAAHLVGGVRGRYQAELQAQDARVRARHPAGARLLQGRDPLAVPERRLPGPPQLRRPGGGRELLPEERRGPDPARGGPDRRPGAGALQVFTLRAPRGGPQPPALRAAPHARGEDDHRRRTRVGRGRRGQGLPGGRHLPGDRAVLRRVGPAQRGGAVRERADAARRAAGRGGHGAGAAAGRAGRHALRPDGGGPPPRRARWPACGPS